MAHTEINIRATCKSHAVLHRIRLYLTAAHWNEAADFESDVTFVLCFVGLFGRKMEAYLLKMNENRLYNGRSIKCWTWWELGWIRHP